MRDAVGEGQELQKKRSTDELIMESTRELMRNGSVEKLTVRAIADNCGVTTQTFYNHYQDKFEVIARIYTEAMAPYVMSSLEEWFDAKASVTTDDIPFFRHAFNYSGQNNLKSTLVEFDMQKYLLHVKPEIPRDSLEMKLICYGLASMIYGQFGLYDVMLDGRIALSEKDIAEHFSSIKDVTLLWAPQNVVNNLLEMPTCEYAYWDPEEKRIVVKA